MDEKDQDLQGAHVVYVDDNKMLHDVLDRLLTRHGITVTSFTNADKALALIEEDDVDLVITEASLSDMDGVELLDQIKEEQPHIKVIMVTGQANVQHAVDVMKRGAVDYMPKPFSTTEFVERIREHLTTPEPEEKKRSVAASAPPPPPEEGDESDSILGQYVGEHPTIKNLKHLVPPVAQSKAPVFIHGESGTGKEILARIVHQKSERSGGAYITINCANLPRELVESHLFGHRKGAFTGAIEDREGAFELADEGTLLLDEVTEIDLPVQAKLLRVLQEQEFQKVGDPRKRTVDVRVIATSNRDLREAVEDGDFREDLYHRLAVFPLHVPPLRERISDIPLLARHFVRKYCRMYDMAEKEIDPELLRRFREYSWPGNVRQLENMIHRGVALATDRPVIEISDVFNEFITDGRIEEQKVPKERFLNGMTIEEMERQMILEALRETESQQSAAERLGISARTIRNKLKKYRDEGYSV
jgi:DNA-binding NtrC family response regulator